MTTHLILYQKISYNDGTPINTSGHLVKKSTKTTAYILVTIIGLWKLDDVQSNSIKWSSYRDQSEWHSNGLTGTSSTNQTGFAPF